MSLVKFFKIQKMPLLNQDAPVHVFCWTSGQVTLPSSSFFFWQSNSHYFHHLPLLLHLHPLKRNSVDCLSLQKYVTTNHDLY